MRLPLSVLVAEDNAVNQRVALHLLGRMGYRADIASNGREAIEALHRRAYDVVLMDVQMPEMDGLEATRRIRREFSQDGPRIIAMTANAMRDDRDKCLAAGMDDYVSKPVHPAHLQSVMVRHATERKIERKPTLDEEVLRELRELQEAGGGSDLIAELVTLFLEDLPDRIEGIRDSIAARDPDTLRRESHRLKGSSQQMGAARLSALCAELEGMGRAGRTDDATPFFLWVEREAGRVRQALREQRA
jgi:CheY-like chemotaxis protein